MKALKKKDKLKIAGNKSKGASKIATSKRAGKSTVEAHFKKHANENNSKASKGADEEW